MEIFLSGVLIIGVLCILIGWILLVVEAFHTSVLWGLGTLFIKPVTLIYAIVHWDRAKSAAVIFFTGYGIVLVGALAGMGLSVWTP